MKKTYVSKATRMRILVEVSGVRKPIPFAWDIVSSSGAMGCSYTTDDEAEQTAIENHELFGKRIQLSEDTLKAMVEVKPNKENSLSIEEARRLLREEYGKSANETRTKIQVQTLMNELGLASSK